MLVVNSVCTCAATIWIVAGRKRHLSVKTIHMNFGWRFNASTSDVKTLTKLIDNGEVKVKGKILGVAEAGTLKAWCLFGVPIVVRQYNPNFKEKWHIGKWPLLSLSRPPSSRVVKTETEDRPPCLYLRKLFKTPLQFRLAKTSNCHAGQIAVTSLLKGTFEELP